jgi:hypothetical protein
VDVAVDLDVVLDLVHRSRNRVNASTVELIHHEPTQIDQADGKEAR